jgi:tellurite resistance protein TerC
MQQSIGTPTLWLAFIGFVLFMLMLDLGVFHRKSKAVSSRDALVWTLVWVTMAMIFNVGVWHWFGTRHALEFFTGYLLEKALSVDNLFVFLLIFSYFSVPAKLQHRVLFWGILGALILRAVFIVAGAALIQKFHWIMYLFGAFLVFTGAKLVLGKDSEMDPAHNPVLRLYRRFVRSVPEYREAKFFVVENGRLWATPLLLVLVVVETTDVIFAVDSIPAVFGVTTDPFIVFTSNIFAILGLRSLYFLLADMMDRFAYLKIGLGGVLAFIGLKMLLADIYDVPIGISLGVVSLLLVLSVVISLLKPPQQDGDAPAAVPEGLGDAQHSGDSGATK